MTGRTVLVLLIAWCVLSIPAGFVLGRVAAGNSHRRETS